MIYLFTGSDTEKVRMKAFEWVAKAREKESNLTYLRIAPEELTSAALEDAAQSNSLFAKRILVLIDDPYQTTRVKSEDEEGNEEEEKSTNPLDDALDLLAASENAIVILAPRLLAAKKKKIEAKAKMVYAYDAIARRDAARGFNSGLVNALALRSRERLWLEVERALRQGDAPEMIHGLLHWKARDLMEKGSTKWSPAEARELSLSLISLLMSSRRGGLPLPVSLEKFALSI